MKCPNCRKQIMNGMEFCPYCGVSLKAYYKHRSDYTTTLPFLFKLPKKYTFISNQSKEPNSKKRSLSQHSYRFLIPLFIMAILSICLIITVIRLNKELQNNTATMSISDEYSDSVVSSISEVEMASSVSEQKSDVTIITDKIVITAPSGNKVYDGTPLKEDGRGEEKILAKGLPKGYSLVASTTGCQTDVGTSKNVVNENYKIKDQKGNNVTKFFTNVILVDGTLTVTAKPLSITTGSASKEYDGKPLSNRDVQIEGLVNGESVEIRTKGEITEVGEKENTYVIEWSKANKDNYVINEELGILKVKNNSSEINLIAVFDNKTYDGEALSNSGVKVKGLPEGFKAYAVAEGNQLDVGSTENVVKNNYSIKDSTGVDRTSYFSNIKVVNGLLTVAPRVITITTGSASKKYDGTPLRDGSVSIEGLVDGESVEVKATGTITEAGSTDNTYAIVWTNAKENNYSIRDNLGTLEITGSLFGSNEVTAMTEEGEETGIVDETLLLQEDKEIDDEVKELLVEEADNAAIKRIKEAGKVVMLTNAEYEPFEYKKGDSFVGIDIDLAKEISSNLGVELEVVDLSFDSLIPSLIAGKGDFIASGMVATDERRKIIDFTQAYFDASQAIIVNMGSNIDSEEDLNGKVVGVLMGTTGDLYCSNEDGANDINVSEVNRYSNSADAVKDLVMGNIDAFVVDAFPAKKLVLNNQDKIKIGGEMDEAYYCIALPPGSGLTPVVDDLISGLMKSGKLDEIVSKYLDS